MNDHEKRITMLETKLDMLENLFSALGKTWPLIEDMFDAEKAISEEEIRKILKDE